MEQGQQWLQELLSLMGVTATVTGELPVDAIAEHHSEEEGIVERPSCWLTINESTLTPEQIHGLTGVHGNVLDAMQYLANTTLNLGQEPEQQRAYTIELAGYRARRQAELQAMAEQAADQVRQTGQEVELKSLSSAERRQVHTLLKPHADLETYSRGREPDRRLVVRPVGTPQAE